jgi:hypothetical protein
MRLKLGFGSMTDIPSGLSGESNANRGPSIANLRAAADPVGRPPRLPSPRLAPSIRVVSLRIWASLLLAFVPALADDLALVGVGETWRFAPALAPPSPPDPGWTLPGYDDAGWASGRSGFSYYNGGLYEATVLPGPSAGQLAWRFRRTFGLADPPGVKWLVLRVDYDDGFVAYLNGTEVARRGFPPETVVQADTPALPQGRSYAEEIDLSAFVDGLSTGSNVLAFEVHGCSTQDVSLALVAELRANFQRGPLVQNVSADHLQITWKTPVPADSRVEFGLDAGLGQSVGDDVLATNHLVTLSQLQAGTTYYYRVVSSGAGSTAMGPITCCHTLSTSGPVRFVVVGDTGSGWNSQYEVAATLAGSAPDLVLHTGDVIYPRNEAIRTDARCLSVYGAHMRTTPYFFTMGNHDLWAGDAAYLDAFQLPTNAVTGTEHFYSFDHGDVHFCSLFVPQRSDNWRLPAYTLAEGSLQYGWLTNDLAATAKPWKVLLLHAPVITSGPHRVDNDGGVSDQAELQRILLPVAERYGVQLLLSGHDHAFERFAPLRGVHQVVTGGGGFTLYPLYQWDPATAQFAAVFHHVRVAIEGTRLFLEAVDTHGEVIDAMVIHRAPVERRTYAASWHSPRFPSGPADDGDGNVSGQMFDLVGDPVPAVPGKFASLGELFVNNDRDRLYVGLAHAMIRPDNQVFLFVESPRASGVTNLAGLGNGLVDPEGQGADGLDFLENLAFTNFAPTLGCLLGDEYADRSSRSFLRPGTSLDLGQGVFRLDANLTDVPGAWLQQFNRSPQTGSNTNEQNADFMVIAIPFSELGGVQPGDVIRLGAVVGGPGLSTNADHQTRELDTAYCGVSFQSDGQGPALLEGLAVQLAPDPDPDRDGLSTADELRWGTDPNQPDTDGDGLLDGWEVAYGLNPLSAQGEDGALGDPDGDRFTNREEQAAGTNPRDAASALRLAVTVLGDGACRLAWPARVGQSYELEYAEGDGWAFRPLSPGEFPRVATTPNESFTNLPAVPARFYRVRLLP